VIAANVVVAALADRHRDAPHGGDRRRATSLVDLIDAARDDAPRQRSLTCFTSNHHAEIGCGPFEDEQM
jgi:hypothetical protein